MRRFLLITVLALQIISAVAQQRFVDFNTSVPSNWAANNSSEISLSSEHLKGGANALKWTPQNSSVITATSLNIPSSEINHYTESSAQLFVYSNSVSTDTLIFRFYDGSNVLRREGKMLLNYKGWREYHRSYRYDYNSGNESSAFSLSKMEIIYRPSSTNYNTIYFDEMTLVGNADARNPGIHMALDIQHFRLTSAYTKAYFSWINQPDIALTTATSTEINAIQTLKNTYQRNLTSVSAQDVANAKDFIDKCAIVRNTDGSIKGRGIAEIYNVDTLVQLSSYASALARAYAVNSDADALNKLQLFMEYLLEQGLAEGSRSSVPYNNYAAVRAFPVGFLEALPYIADAEIKSEVIKMLKWSHEFNTIYNANPTPGLEMDFMHVKSNFLVELALLGSTNDEIARDLKSFSRYLEQFTYTSQGARDGIKPDGVGFHHNSQHISYQYAYATWINRAFELKGTPFKISLTAYQNMGKAIKALFLETSKGAIYPHSASGRDPFPSSVPVNTTAFDRFVQVGGDITGESAEPEMAGFYNYIFQVNRYTVPAGEYDGYYQLNYAQTGIMRKNNWIAVSRGFTDRMFGAEIYAGANRYGRYQSYGALEVLYGGSLSASGYINGGSGWDWNMMPGATTIRQSYENLKPLISGTASEYQADAFAGALADGNIGVFGMNFIENAGTKYAASNLKFRKSVFTFDSLMVCLGSTISSSNASVPVITTLFQAVNASTNPSIYINSATATSSAYDQAVSTSTNGVWLVNGQTTGYYIPQGNAEVNIYRGSQTTPVHSTDNTATTVTSNVSKAWLSHGTQPTSSKYQFVVVPATTPQKMSALADKIDNEELYKVLKQTDSVHAVQYVPDNRIVYSCFLGQPDINTGYVKGISGRALLSVKEKGDTLIVKIANPDLNAVSNTESTWVSTINQVTVSLYGNWKVVENNSNAGIANQENLLEANFALKDGFSQTLILVNENLTEEENTGIWENQSQQWIYDLTTGTGLNSYGNPPTFQQGSATINGSYSHSMSSAGSAGFLPYPPSGTGRVHIVNATSGTTNGSFVLNADGTLKMSASSSSSVNKFSAYNIAPATAVASMFFSVSFNNTANNGNFIWSIGNKETASNLFSNSSGVYRATTELFTALQWEYTASGVNFNFRESANTSGGTYKLISSSAFKKGETYDVEVYCNNSPYTQNYTRNGESYALPSGSFNIWMRPHGKLVRASRLVYNSSEDIPASGELAEETILNSYLFQGINSTQPTANAAEIVLGGIEINHASVETMPLSLTSFNANYESDGIWLNWKTETEINTDNFKLYRSSDHIDYRQITEVKATGNSSRTISYNFKDTSFPANISELYYTLKAFDNDGTLSYEAVTSVTVPLTDSALKLYPNPASAEINISYNSTKERYVTFRIADVNGRIVHTSNHLLHNGNNHIVIPVSTLASGVYTIQLENKSLKFIKL